MRKHCYESNAINTRGLLHWTQCCVSMSGTYFWHFCFQLQDKDDAFFVADLSDMVAKYRLWKKELPRVEPFYGVSFNKILLCVSMVVQMIFYWKWKKNLVLSVICNVAFSSCQMQWQSSCSVSLGPAWDWVRLCQQGTL